MIPMQLLVIFAIIAVGVICERRKVLNTNQIEGFEIFLFKISMPSYLFSSILGHDLSALVEEQYIYSYLLAFAVIAILVIIFSYKRDRASVICLKILASGYVNAAIYTLPMITFLLVNPIAGVLGTLLQVIVIQTVFITILSLVNHSEKSIAARLLTVFTMPLVVMPIMALICNYFEFGLPHVLTAVIQSLGTGASSIALFIFGLTLGGIKITKSMLNRDLISIVMLKNVAHPLIAFSIGKYVFNLESYWLYSLLIATAAPTAFMVYLVAKQFAIEQHLFKSVVAISSVISLFSLVLISISI